MKDKVTYSVVLEEFDAERGGWRPYTADDVQVSSSQLFSSFLLCIMYRRASVFLLFGCRPLSQIFRLLVLLHVLLSVSAPHPLPPPPPPPP